MASIHHFLFPLAVLCEEFDQTEGEEGSGSASSPVMGSEKEKKKGSASSASATSPCANLRAAYNSCFNRWYAEKFVKGQWEKQDCVAEWKKYRACLSENLDDKHLSRFLEAELPVDSSNQLDDGDGL